jgi:hypothetical protein
MPDRASDAIVSTYGFSLEEAFGGMTGGGMGRVVRASRIPFWPPWCCWARTLPAGSEPQAGRKKRMV